MMHLAYLDAGSGSLIVQAVVGGTAGAAVAAKLYWRRVAARFRRGSAEPTEAPASGQPGGQAAAPASGQPGATVTDQTATVTDRPATAPAEAARADRQPRQPAGN
ncbi:hypothetical protein [Micromonospora humida]|uniref:Uncharacterized protein n=1 Tax=Micromonospora humida TaxID=2809018 RepID=A0ABS2IQE4_9ACTN|nr:hypothetical protein [Micromonospora humida]MBM7076545.1 hypothetical protein [Micromonospora humida]